MKLDATEEAVIAFLEARLDGEMEGVRQLIKAEVPTRWSVSRGDVFGEHGAFVQRRIVEIDSVNLGPVGEQLAGEHIAKFDPWRMLAEIEAKRKLIQQCRDAADYYGTSDMLGPIWVLAAIYKEHADYQDAWKPA